MFHDLCKIDQYRCERQENTILWEYNPDTLFKGHGEKSVMLLSQFFQLTEEEIACIRYHMGAFTPEKEWNDYTRAVKMWPNVLRTHHAPAYFDLLSLTELAGRTCYKSEAKISEGSAEKFVQNILKRGHEAVIEHGSVTVRFTCDRGVSHEIVRHRLASYCQESTRYCNYGKEQFGTEITFIAPAWTSEGYLPYTLWKKACEEAEQSYFKLLDIGCSPQEARSVLPNSTKTEVVTTANIQE